MDSYLSCKRFETSFEIEKSEFIANVAPVGDEAEAVRFIGEIRAKYPDATHNCFAYVCDAERNIFRFSDDGEPAKTAGMPILDAIRGRKLFNTAVVVTRYFGGIKLGAGGLCRAYSRAALAAIDGAGTTLFQRAAALEILCGYDQLPRVEQLLKNRERSCQREFGERVLVRCFEIEDRVDSLIRELADATDGRAELRKIGRTFLSFSI